MAGLADIYVLDLQQSFEGEVIHNIWTFHKLGTGISQDLIDAFQSDLLPKIALIQNVEIITKLVRVYSLGNLGDTGEEVFSLPGGQDTGQMLPVFNAMNFTLRPVGRTVRPGSKRFAGVPELVQNKGTITDATYLGQLESLRVGLANELSTDDVNFWQPCITKRVKYEVPDSDPVRFAYRYPETDEELVFAPVGNAVTTTKVSHQVSRGN